MHFTHTSILLKLPIPVNDAILSVWIWIFGKSIVNNKKVWTVLFEVFIFNTYQISYESVRYVRPCAACACVDLLFMLPILSGYFLMNFLKEILIPAKLSQKAAQITHISFFRGDHPCPSCRSFQLPFHSLCITKILSSYRNLIYI